MSMTPLIPSHPRQPPLVRRRIRRLPLSLLLFSLISLFLLLLLFLPSTSAIHTRKPQRKPRAVKLNDAASISPSAASPSSTSQTEQAAADEVLLAFQSALAGGHIGDSPSKDADDPRHRSPSPQAPSQSAQWEMRQPQPQPQGQRPLTSSDRRPSPTSANLTNASLTDSSTISSSHPHWLSSYWYPLLGSGVALLSLSFAWLYYRYRTSPKPSLHTSDVHTRPLLVQLSAPRGRLQGCDWAVQALRWDEEGDCAHQFLGPFTFHQGGQQLVKEEAGQSLREEAQATGEAGQEGEGRQVKGVRRRKK